jgi:phage shock protein E
MDNVFLFVGVASIAIGSYLKYEYNYKHISKISPKIAKSLIKRGAKLLDVRTRNEFKLGSVTRKDNGNIKTIAINIPGKELNDKTLRKNEFKKDDIIIVFCNSGTRARKAADKLIKLGYTNVYYIVETHLSLQE